MIKSLKQYLSLRRLLARIFKEDDSLLIQKVITEKIVAPIMRKILGTVFAILATLKVVNYIDWSWWIIFFPFIAAPFVGISLGLIIRLIVVIWVDLQNKNNSNN